MYIEFSAARASFDLTRYSYYSDARAIDGKARLLARGYLPNVCQLQFGRNAIFILTFTFSVMLKGSRFQLLQQITAIFDVSTINRQKMEISKKKYV